MAGSRSLGKKGRLTFYILGLTFLILGTSSQTSWPFIASGILFILGAFIDGFKEKKNKTTEEEQ